MSPIERHKKEKGDLRRIILSAAREIFLEKGFDQTSMRTIAQNIGYSATTIYLYFKDKDAILYALHKDGFDILSRQMEVLIHVEDPFERIKAMGRLYLHFANEHHDYYDLMFVQKAPMDSLNGEHETWKEGQSSFDALRFSIQECMDKKLLLFKDADAGAYLVWSTMHGMCTLYDRGRCKVLDEEKRDLIVDLAFNEFISLLEAFRA